MLFSSNVSSNMKDESELVGSVPTVDSFNFQRVIDECLYPRQKFTCFGLLGTTRRKTWFSVALFLCVFEVLFFTTIFAVLKDARQVSLQNKLNTVSSATILDLQEAFSAISPEAASEAVRKTIFTSVPPLRRPTDPVFQHPITRPNYWTENLFKWTSLLGYLREHKITDENITKEAADFAEFAARVKGSVPPPELAYEPGTEGIVTSMIGRQDGFSLAHLLYHLYALNTTVPVELWVEKGDDTPGLHALVDRLFPRGLVHLRVLEDVKPYVEKITGPLERAAKQKKFYLKTQAIAASRFQHVFWLDVDSFILRDPKSFLSDLRARNQSAVFWHDSYAIWDKNPVWRILNRTKTPHKGPACESGIMYLDKSKMWDAIVIAARMNQKQSLYSTLLWGDKDTIFLAMDYLGEKYEWVPYVPYFIGRGRTIASFSGLVISQGWFDGRPAAVHFVSGKRFLPRDVITVSNQMPLTGEGENRKRIFHEVLRYDPDNAHIITCPFRTKRFTVFPDGFHPKIDFLPYKSVISNFEDTFFSYSDMAGALSGQFHLGNKR